MRAASKDDQGPGCDRVEPQATADAATPLGRRIALGALAAACAAGSMVAPMDAGAVAGGGGISTPQNNMDFSNRDMRKVLSFTKAQIRNTNFTNSDLRGVSLFGSIAPGSNFHNANLSLAILDSADIENSDLSGANLTGAYVSNTQFQGTNIKDTDWTDVSLTPAQQKYLCSIASGTNPMTGNDTRETLECP